MRSTSAAALAVGTLLLLWAANVFDLAAPREAFHGAVAPWILAGQAAVESYSASVEAAVEENVGSLFDELDSNGDGVLQRSEFRGASLGVLAAMRSVQLPDFAELPGAASRGVFTRLVVALVGFDIVFLIGLYVFEHLRVIVFGQRKTLRLFGYEDAAASVQKVSVAEAMTYDTPLTRYEKAKILFFLCTGMLFVRIFFFFLFFACGAFTLHLSVLGGRNRRNNPTWFWACEKAVYFFGRMMLISVGFAKIVVHGQRDPRCKLLVGNHVNVIEVVYLFISASLPSFVSRIENLNIPLFKTVTDSCSAVLVDRDAAASRAKTLQTIKARAKEPESVPLMMFPEGTCNMQRGLFQFKRGAFEPGLPVQMVAFKYVYHHFNPTWNGRAVGGNDLADLALRLASQFVNRLEVAFLPPYTPSTEEAADATLYAAKVQRMMGAVLQAPVSDARYEDYVAAARAQIALGRAMRGSRTPSAEDLTSPAGTPAKSPPRAPVADAATQTSAE